MSTQLPHIAPYAEAHKHPHGQGDARPTALQIVKDQGLVGELTHTTIAITGADAGLGLETTRALFATGAHIIMLCIDASNGQRVADQLKQEADTQHIGKIDVVQVDLGDLDSVRSAAVKVKELANSRLDVLVCNAGVMSPPIGTTRNGLEPHIGINFFGHFYLFHQLLPALSTTSSPASRVLTLSSLGHRASKLDLDEFPAPPTGDTAATASPDLYHDSKLALMWMANEIDRRYLDQNVRAFAVSPGSIPTQLTAHIGWEKIRDHMGEHAEYFDTLRKSVAQGAASTVWAAVGKELEGQGGIYIEDVQIAKPAKEGTPMFTHGFAPYAYDAAKAGQLWDKAVRVLAEKGYTVAE